MNSPSFNLTALLFHVAGYLYKTLCTTLLALFLLKLMVSDGSWINYLIISAAGVTIWLAGCFFAQTLKMRLRDQD